MTDWQPFETAPKDGRLVIAWAKGQPVIVGYSECDGWYTHGPALQDETAGWIIMNKSVLTHWLPYEPLDTRPMR